MSLNLVHTFGLKNSFELVKSKAHTKPSIRIDKNFQSYRVTLCSSSWPWACDPPASAPSAGITRMYQHALTMLLFKERALNSLFNNKYLLSELYNKIKMQKEPQSGNQRQNSTPHCLPTVVNMAAGKKSIVTYFLKIVSKHFRFITQCFTVERFPIASKGPFWAAYTILWLRQRPLSYNYPHRALALWWRAENTVLADWRAPGSSPVGGCHLETAVPESIHSTNLRDDQSASSASLRLLSSPACALEGSIPRTTENNLDPFSKYLWGRPHGKTASVHSCW